MARTTRYSVFVDILPHTHCRCRQPLVAATRGGAPRVDFERAMPPRMLCALRAALSRDAAFAAQPARAHSRFIPVQRRGYVVDEELILFTILLFMLFDAAACLCLSVVIRSLFRACDDARGAAIVAEA